MSSEIWLCYAFLQIQKSFMCMKPNVQWLPGTCSAIRCPTKHTSMLVEQHEAARMEWDGSTTPKLGSCQCANLWSFLRWVVAPNTLCLHAWHASHPTLLYRMWEVADCSGHTEPCHNPDLAARHILWTTTISWSNSLKKHTSLSQSFSLKSIWRGATHHYITLFKIEILNFYRPALFINVCCHYLLLAPVCMVTNLLNHVIV